MMSEELDGPVCMLVAVVTLTRSSLTPGVSAAASGAGWTWAGSTTDETFCSDSILDDGLELVTSGALVSPGAGVWPI